MSVTATACPSSQDATQSLENMQNIQNSQTIKNIPTFNLQNANLASYADITDNLTSPNKDQCLIMMCEEGLTLSDYVNAIGIIIQPQNILFASKIAKNRIQLCLADKKFVPHITDSNEFLMIKDKKVFIRPLTSKYKRIILSNVSPFISNKHIEFILDQLQVTRNSKVSYVKASLDIPEFKHIYSHRRQVYVKNEDIEKIPKVIRLNFDDTEYYIYSSTDVLKCFLCNTEGHTAKNCVTNLVESDEQQGTLNKNNNNTTTITSENSPPTFATPTPVDVYSLSPQAKRPLTLSTGSTSSSRPTAPKDINNKNNSSKKAKVEKLLNYDKVYAEFDKGLEKCQSAFISIDKSVSFDFNNFVDFVKKTYKCASIVNVANELTKNVSEITLAIDTIYPHIQGTNTKSRITRIKKKILKINANLDFSEPNNKVLIDSQNVSHSELSSDDLTESDQE